MDIQVGEIRIKFADMHPRDAELLAARVRDGVIAELRERTTGGVYPSPTPLRIEGQAGDSVELLASRIVSAVMREINL